MGLEQTSTLSPPSLYLRRRGRLTQVQNTPAGKGCTTRIYAYEEDTNRTSLTTYAPGTKGNARAKKAPTKNTATTRPTVSPTPASNTAIREHHQPPLLRRGRLELVSTFYTDNQLASQTQNGETIGYNLDPAGRTLETVATGKKASDITNHYAGPGSAPAWTVKTTGEWTRNISGINGSLAAIQNSGETPVLQLTTSTATSSPPHP